MYLQWRTQDLALGEETRKYKFPNFGEKKIALNIDSGYHKKDTNTQFSSIKI